MKKSNCIFWSGIGLVFVAALSVLLVFSLLGRIYQPGSALHKMHQEIDVQETIKGNGNIVSDEKELPKFNKVSVSGAYVINVISGHTSKLTMESDDNILHKIKVAVKEGKLEIRVDKLIRLLPSSPIKITIVTPELREIQLAGDTDISALNLNSAQLIVSTAGHNNVALTGQIKQINLGLSGASNINLTDSRSESININSAGAGKVQISGATNNLKINNAGTINVDAKKLVAKKVSITGAGSISVDVHAIDQLILNTLGKASIHYSGNPEVINHSAGSMKLSK